MSYQSLTNELPPNLVALKTQTFSMRYGKMGADQLSAAVSEFLMWMRSSCLLGLPFNLRSWLGEDLLPSSLLWLLVGLGSSWTLGPRASVFHWLCLRSLLPGSHRRAGHPMVAGFP